jgi:hypothetical protein
MYYHDPPHSEGARFTGDTDLESSARAPEFLDGYRRLFPARLGEQSFLVLDVRTVLVERGRKEEGPSVGVEAPGGKRSFWGLLPLSKDIVYGEGAHFVSAGVSQVPLMEGAVPRAVLEAERPMRALLHGLGSPKSDPAHLRLSGGSALVMLQNPLLRGVLRTQCPELYQVRTAPPPAPAPGGGAEDHSPRPPHEEDCDSGLVARNLDLTLLDRLVSAVNGGASEAPLAAAKLRFDPGRFLGVKTLSGLLGGADPRQLKKSINKHFADYTGISENF